MIRYFLIWKEWAEGNMNSPIHKFLVLVGLVKSPTFEFRKQFK